MRLFWLFVLVVIAGCAAPRSPSVTLSGVSSGGYMALQMQVAFSDRIAGAAAVAAGPYDCAKGNILNALGPCIKGPPPSSEDTLELMRARQADGSIAPVTRLKGRPIWLFHGAQDTVVARQVVEHAAAVFEQLDANVQRVTDVPAAHGMPTTDQGAACGQMQTPFLNACDYDAAGEALAFILGVVDSPSARALNDGAGRMIDVPQPQAPGLAAVGKAYVSPQCEAADNCDVHVVFHGCQQGIEFVEQAFVTQAGYNIWADRLDLVILYPQVAASQANPLGCWDWWGYSGEAYAQRDAPQMRAVLSMVDTLRSPSP